MQIQRKTAAQAWEGVLMEGSIYISSPEEHDGLEIKLQLTFTQSDFIDAALSGDVVLALQQTLRTTERFGNKLAAIVALVAAVQDKNLNPVLRMRKLDMKPTRRR